MASAAPRGSKSSVGGAWLLAAVMLLLGVTLFVSAASADLGDSPTITVTPNTDLSDDGTVSVTVDGSGFLPGIPVQIAQCRTAVGAGTSCDNYEPVTTSTDGGFSTVINVAWDKGGPSLHCDWSDTKMCRVVAYADLNNP